MLTREQIEAEPWFGGQKEQVLELLARAEDAERRATKLRDRFVLFIDQCPTFVSDSQADSNIKADLQRAVFAIWKGEEV